MTFTDNNEFADYDKLIKEKILQDEQEKEFQAFSIGPLTTTDAPKRFNGGPSNQRGK